MQNIRRVDLERHRIAQALRCLDRGLRGVDPHFARDRHAPGSDQLLALGLRQRHTAEVPQPGDGLLLRRGARRGSGKTVSQAALAPGVVIEPVLQTACQLIRRVEDGNIGAFELRQPGRGTAAAGPQEDHALVALIALADHLLGLAVCPGTGDDQRAHLGIIDHCVHDLRKRLAVGKARDIGGIRRPAKALEHAVDAITSLVAERGQIEPGLATHIGRQRADPTRMGHHRNARAAGFRRVRQQVRDFQEFVIILHPDDPVLRKHRVVERIRPGERCGMRTCRPRAEFGAANFNQDDGFAAFGCQPGDLEELAGMLKAFDKAGNHPGGRDHPANSARNQ